MDEFDVDNDEFADMNVTDAELDALCADENDEDDTSYNLIAKATAECLSGDCDHFCGEPTQADLDRLERRGYGHLVEAYENNIQYV